MGEFINRQSIKNMSKTKKIALSGIVAVLIITMLFSMFNANAFGAQAVADDSTLTKWEGTTGQDTKNIGRIWTDKSVSTGDVKLSESDAGVAPEIKIGDSDFLVTLSALSSAGSITGETVSTKPLDIVLVLDTSGSMGDPMGDYTYVPTYNVSTNGRTTYYAEVDGEYVEIDRVTTGYIIQRFDHWELNGIEVEPKTSANDNTEGHIQFYTYRSGTKMDALKTAATSFVDSTLAENKEISDTDKQHRISLVTFARSATTQHELKTVDVNNAAAINSTINGLNANGATAADYAMNNTKTVLNSARPEAQKVVIFFTDGEPNHQSGFDGDVANDAIAVAKDLKAADTKIYSIGMFSNANPDNTTSNFNAYMHGVSSNYPNASSYQNLGERATNADGSETAYYKKASDSAELSKVFDEIFKDISSIEASSPFEDGTGTDGENMAAVTFHDKLGDYMKVDDFKSIVFADKVFKDPTILKNPIEGEDKEIIQYTFEGTADTGNTIYPKGDLNEIIITVERYDDPAKGDVVTVTIPASMIPLREYVVDTTGEKTMTIDDTFPLRIFYGASLKDEAKTLLANPDDAMKAYIKANKNDQGQVNFYSNKYYTDGTNNGGVYVEFTPNETNDFYYFQENEALYLDEACTERATGTEIDTSKTYYYDRLYYALEGGKPEERHNIVKIDGDSPIVEAGYVTSDAEGLYIPSGTPRTTSLATHALNKVDNTITNTASYVTAPDWDSLDNPQNVIVKLGNNGLLPVDIPGTLEVTKKVTADEGLTAPADAEFDFTLDLTAPSGSGLQSSYKAQKFDKNNDPVGEEFTIADNGTFKLKADQTVRIYGLEDGVDYKVTEAEHQGFTTTATGDSGNIVKNETAIATFTNNYEVDDLIVHAEDFGLKGTKNIEGRTFESGDAFRFEIKASALASDSPVPTNPTEEIEPTEGSSANISFGDFTFTKPGQYRYTISEFLPNGDNTATDKFDKVLPGMTYDTTEYRLVVEVTDDNGDGELDLKNVEIAKRVNSATSEWEVLYSNADGTLPAQDYLNFTNKYSVTTQAISLNGTKILENKDFDDYGTGGQFGFKIEAKGSRAVDSESSVEWTEDANQPMPTASGSAHGDSVYSNSDTGAISIPGITFGHDDVGKEYKYEIKELQPLDKVTGDPLEGAVQNSDGKWVYNGVTLDNSIKEIIIKVKSTNVNNQEVIQATVTGNGFTFTNTYNAEADYAFSGTKTITNRNFKDGDKFTFKVEPQNGAPAPINDTVTIEPKEGTEAAVSFGNIHFTQNDVKDAAIQADGSRSKTFTYRVWEEKGDIGGIKYDSVAKTVKITVTDDGAGNLTAEATDDSAALEWNNVYEASMTYSTGINVQKTLTGRNMIAGEFDFTITPQDGTPAVGDSDAKFKNGASAAGTPNVMKKLSTLRFTQADAGKTFTYLIDETEPATAAGNGVTYDKSQYKVVIVPQDKGDGTMTATTTVYRTVDKDGNVLDSPVELTGDEKIAFNNSYAPAPGTLSGATALEVTKNFTGRENNKWLESDEFAFELILDTESLPVGVTADDVQMPADTTITIDDTDADKKASFGNIVFKKAGTYTFAVVEKQDGLANKGITGDKVIRIIKIVVTDNHEGQLVATKDINNSTDLYFTNTYSASAAAFAGINVQKTLPAERGWKDGDKFSFRIEGNDQDEATMDAIEAGNVVLPDLATVEITKADEDHTKAFGKITFKQAGEYSFKVTEVVPEDKDKISGIEYNTESKVVNVVVTDNNSGELVAKVKTGDTTTADNTTVTVANTYTPADAGPVATTGLFTKVIDGRDWLDTDKFTFTITPENGGPNPEKTSVEVTSGTAKDGDKVAFDFGKIEFTASDMLDDDGSRLMEKTFSYTIEEVNAGADEDGLQYSKNKATMNITVKDDGTGKLTAGKPVITEGEGTFTNSYYTDEATFASLNVKKTLTGREWKDRDSFKFTLVPTGDTIEAVEGKWVVMPEPAEVTITNETADKTAAFGAITFAEAGTYTFDVIEENAGKVIGGVQYAGDAKAVTIKVTDNNKGQLVAKVGDADTATVEFTNTYKAADATFAKLNVAKVLEGRDWKSGDSFKFTLTATGDTVDNENVVMPQDATVTITDETKDKTKAFEAITFKAAGEYTFKITEEKGSIGGITYAPAQEVTINVTDNKAGKLVATVADKDEATLTFTNTYTPGATDPVATTGLFTKVIDGRDWIDSDTFTFTIEPQNGAPAPENKTATVTKADVKDGKAAFDFGTIGFTADHMKGATENNGVKTKTFTYEVTENKAGTTENGLTYSENVATMTITVTDDGTGKLTAAATVANGEFKNTYNSTLDYKASVNMFITKVLEGRELEANQFGFTVKPADPKSADKFGIALDGRQHFTRAAGIGEESQMQVILGEDKGKFTADDVGETYSYTVEETKKGGTGYTNDTEVATVTITTTDDNKGTLTVTTSVEKGGKTTTTSVSTGEIKQGETPKTIKIPFVNYYNEDPGHLSDDGDATIVATKEITGRDLKDGEFNFTVTDKNDKEVATGTNDADGKIHFTDIVYDMAHMEADVDAGIATVDKESKYPEYIYTYQYTVSEKVEGLADKGITASTPQYNITVTVTDDAKGSLHIKVGYPDGKDKLEFKNQYGENTANVSISGQKVLTMLSGDKTPDIANKYTFKLTGSDGAPMPAKTTAKNAADGTIAFGDITYTMDNTFGNEGTDRREKTFTYTVTEEGKVDGVANDSKKTFKVKVVDDGNGHIAAEAIGANGALFQFDNKYSVDEITSSVTDTIKIKKNLGGDREMKAGEFEFELVENGNVVKTAANDADGNVTFGAIKYDNVGTHEYTVREVNNGLGGITYDTNSYKIVTNVTDNGDGTLKVEHKRVATTEEEQKSDIVFKNTYKATPTSVTLGAAKVLKNGNLEDGQFTFVLKDSKGDVVSEAKNDAKGSIRFDTMEFDKAGTFEYTVSEAEGNDKNIRYDETEYKITIEVKDDGNGNMTAEITKGAENGITFVNTVEADAGTKTGDNMPLAALAIVMMAATGAGIVTVRRKIKN